MACCSTNQGLMYIHDYDEFSRKRNAPLNKTFTTFWSTELLNEKIHKSVVHLHHLLKRSLNSSKIEMHLNLGSITQRVSTSTWAQLLFLSSLICLIHCLCVIRNNRNSRHSGKIFNHRTFLKTQKSLTVSMFKYVFHLRSEVSHSVTFSKRSWRPSLSPMWSVIKPQWLTKPQ